MPEFDLFANETGGSSVILSKKDKTRLAYLERVLTVLIKQHGEGEPTVHPDTNEPVSDLAFDQMWDELEKLSPDSPVVKGTASAAPLDPNAKKMKHDPPMTSIKKANGTLAERKDAFDKFVSDIATGLNCTRDNVLKKLVVSYKRDGVACSLSYVDGKLVQAGLRPRDGIWGEDVTDNIKYVKGVPPTLPSKITCVVRGELECKISTFNQLNGSAKVDGQEFANPRNYTTGSIRQYKDPSKTASRELSFTAYNIVGMTKAPYKTERERAIWCNKNLGIPFVRTEFWTPSLLEELELNVPKLDYEVDGAVVSVDDLEEQEQMGFHGSAANANPKGKLAWKFNDETADPIIDKIVWETGRTGQLVPVVHFKGVKLAGTTVVKASAHALGFLVRNNIHIATQIKIRKSGKIIPEVMGHWEGTTYIYKLEAGDPKLPKDFNLKAFDYPKNCISCGKATQVDVGGSHGMLTLTCNNADCPSQNIKRFLNYLEKFGVKGVGEASVTAMVEAGLVKSLSDFYKLSITDLKDNGWSIREALLDVARIHMIDAPEQEKDNRALATQIVDAMKRKKTISLSKFIATLGVSGASKGTGSTLAMHFRDLKAIISADEDALTKCADIGSTTAKSLVQYFSIHKKDIETLIDKCLEVELPKSGKFSNKTFVFTGSPGDEGKDYWKQKVEDEGGIVKSSVTKSIDYVIIGADAGQKADIARDMKSQGHNLTIVETRDELLKLFK